VSRGDPAGTSPAGHPGRLRSPYEGARVEELEEPLLPRWFVLLALGAIPVALGVAVWAFVAFGPDDLPVAERRPPPAPTGALTTDVGQYTVGESEAVDLPLEGCAPFQGVRAAGSEADRQRIDAALVALCDGPVPEDVARRIRLLGQRRGEIRFAQFQATGVDSTLDLGADPPRVLLNARFAREDTDPLWIAPLVVHDTTYLEAPVGTAASALEARTREADACERLLVDARPSRACEDAAALLALLDPVRALQAAGFD
jgi:hypothetical protein